MDQQLLVCRAGTMEYGAAWDFQRRLGLARRQDVVPDVLVLVQHPATITVGRRGAPEHVLLTERQLKRKGVALFHVDRGGDATYHGPGQLVGYPILKIQGSRLDRLGYLRDLELALLRAVCALGVEAHLIPGLTGVWVDEQKVCALGAKIDAFGVTTHGFALNVNIDLAGFSLIVPCGLHDMGVTSLQRSRKRRVSMQRVEKVVVESIATTFRSSPRTISMPRILSLLDTAAGISARAG